MALRKTFIENSEIVTTVSEFGEIRKIAQPLSMDCYIKVNQVNASKENAIAEVMFKFENSNKIKNYSFVPSMNGENFIKQTYEHLKTLPEFASAIDC